MTPAAKRDLSGLLHDSLIAYWHDVDFNWGRNAGAYYTVDAVFETAGQDDAYRGRAEIEAFYAYRRDRGPRVVLHAVANFLCTDAREAAAETAWVCLLHAHDGEPPQESAPPISIALVRDSHLLQDGGWLVSRRTWHSMFRGGVPGTVASRAEIARRTGQPA